MNYEDKFKRSPYLEEHSTDPVKWKVWDEDLFEISKKEDKPLFITIGYSTCHWCHVMQSESFRNKEVSEILNDKYTPVVVDREERPDVDSFYMEVSQIMNGSGGWPLNVIALPDGRPFQVFTYLPAYDQQGKGGLIDVLKAISDIWKNERGRIIDAADQVASIILSPDKKMEGEVNPDDAVGTLQAMYDRQNGGFGSQPKFPNFSYSLFLLSYMRYKKTKNLSYMVEKTLKNLRNGGIYDQVGYGIHRYSTDSEWKIPHFEKMLYDQAMAIWAYTEFFRFTGDRQYLDVAREVVDFVNRDMKDSYGFYVSGLDADFNGTEGLYYTWDESEMRKELGEELMKETGEGYYFDRDSENRIVLRRREIVNVSGERLESLRNLNEKLLKIREKKGNPKRDDKAILSWNCVLLSSMIRYSISNDMDGFEELINTGNKIISTFSSEGTLYRTIRKGSVGVVGLLEDYAYYVNLMIDLHEVTGQNGFLSEAIGKIELVKARFLDRERGGFFSSSNTKDRTMVRVKDRLDIIYPSGESILYLDLEKLYLMTGNEEYRELSQSILSSRINEIIRNPLSSVYLLSSLLMKEKMMKIEVPDNLRNDLILKLGAKHFPELVISRAIDGIQICDDKACHFHGENLDDAIKYLIAAK